jgi:hypothetical protein
MLPANMFAVVYFNRENAARVLPRPVPSFPVRSHADLLPLRAHKGQRLAPFLLTSSSVSHIDVRVTVGVARDFPCESWREESAVRRQTRRRLPLVGRQKNQQESERMAHGASY